MVLVVVEAKKVGHKRAVVVHKQAHKEHKSEVEVVVLSKKVLRKAHKLTLLAEPPQMRRSQDSS